MYRCKCCDTELPDGTKTCPQCLLGQEPTPKFMPGQLVKMTDKEAGAIIYNNIFSSYFDHVDDVRWYVLAGSKHVTEDKLEAVGYDEMRKIIESGKLTAVESGGFAYPIEQEVHGNEDA